MPDPDPVPDRDQGFSFLAALLSLYRKAASEEDVPNFQALQGSCRARLEKEIHHSRNTRARRGRAREKAAWFKHLFLLRAAELSLDTSLKEHAQSLRTAVPGEAIDYYTRYLDLRRFILHKACVYIELDAGPPDDEFRRLSGTIEETITLPSVRREEVILLVARLEGYFFAKYHRAAKLAAKCGNNSQARILRHGVAMTEQMIQFLRFAPQKVNQVQSASEHVEGTEIGDQSSLRASGHLKKWRMLFSNR